MKERDDSIFISDFSCAINQQLYQSLFTHPQFLKFDISKHSLIIKMKLYIGTPKQLPFAILTFSWMLLMELAHQYYLSPENSYIRYLSFAILIFTVYNYFRCCFKQPGIVPNTLASIQDITKFQGMNIEEQEDQIIAETSRTSRRTLGAPITQRNTSTHIKQLNYKYCDQCRQIKPPNAQHCIRCFACIKRHYKHSPIIANCIGERNIKNYFGMIIGLSCLGVFYIVKGTFELFENWKQYVEVPQHIFDNGELKLLLSLLLSTIFFRWIISRRFLKIRCILLVMTILVITAGILYFKIVPILNTKTGFIWVFVSLAYFITPIIFQSLGSVLILILTGKTRKQLEIGSLKLQERAPKKMLGNLCNFLINETSS